MKTKKLFCSKTKLLNKNRAKPCKLSLKMITRISFKITCNVKGIVAHTILIDSAEPTIVWDKVKSIASVLSAIRNLSFMFTIHHLFCSFCAELMQGMDVGMHAQVPSSYVCFFKC